VRAVHAEYAAAGAEVLETNTFGANRVKLTQYGSRGTRGTSTARRRGWRATSPATTTSWPVRSAR
jgi:methionine synthase I (cobalamin-dependent)